MKETWPSDNNRYGNVLIHWFRDYLDDLRGLLLDNHFWFFILSRFFAVPLRGGGRRVSGRKKSCGRLADYGLGPVRRKRQPLGTRGAACRRQHLVQRLRSKRVVDFPAVGRLNPGTTQRAEGILSTITDESQILGELLRERPLALGGIGAAG